MTTATRTAAPAADKSLNDYLAAEINRRGLAKDISDQNPNRNWMGMIRQVLRGLGFEGANQDDKATEIFTNLTFSPGSLWRYNAETGVPLEKFFAMAARRKAVNKSRDRATDRRKMPTVNISPGKSDEAGGGISEGVIPGAGENPTQDSVYTKELFSEFGDYLKSQLRPGQEPLLEVYSRMLQGMTQTEIAGETGLSAGQVNHWKSTIIMYLERFATGTNDAGLAALVKRFKDFSNKSDAQRTDLSKPRVNTLWVSPDGAEVPIEVKRRGPNTSRIRLKSETEIPEGWKKFQANPQVDPKIMVVPNGQLR
jgi:transcriptional regulator with XRE-family HTH domain